MRQDTVEYAVLVLAGDPPPDTPTDDYVMEIGGYRREFSGARLVYFPDDCSPEFVLVWTETERGCFDYASINYIQTRAFWDAQSLGTARR